MFKQLYLGEMKKLFRPKSLITLSVIIILLLVFYAIGYNFLIDESNSVEVEIGFAAENPEQGDLEIDPDTDEDFANYLEFTSARYGVEKYTPEQIDELIVSTKEEIKRLEKEKDRGIFGDMLYEEKGYLVALEYIKEHKIFNEQVEIHSPIASFFYKSAEAFTQGFKDLLLVVVIIYGMAIGAGSFAAEMQNGTLKMLFMRPITRNKLVTAKLLSLLSMITMILLSGILLSYLYGLIKYGVAPTVKGIIVFNAMAAFVGSKSMVFFLNIMFGLLQAFALCIFAFALGTVTKNRVASTIISILIYMGILSTILSFFKIERFLFTSNANLGVYFGVTSVIPARGNFFIALPCFLAYVAIFVTATYVVFNKRDVA